MKKMLNVTKDGVCQTITAHYYKEGVGNIIGGGSSIVLATAVIEYEDGIQDGSEGRDRDDPSLSIKDIAFTINANPMSDRLQKVIEVYEGDYKV